MLLININVKNLNKSQENPQYIHSDKVEFIVEVQR